MVRYEIPSPPSLGGKPLKITAEAARTALDGWAGNLKKKRMDRCRAVQEGRVGGSWPLHKGGGDAIAHPMWILGSRAAPGGKFLELGMCAGVDC